MKPAKTYNRSYANLYDKILTETMQYVETDNIMRFKLQRPDIKDHDLIYASAVASAAPITLVYTPAGSGKSIMVKSRVDALKNIGIKGEEIIVLNMNIAKCKNMLKEMSDVNVMTFSDFTHNIFTANYPDCKLSDINSIINTLRLQPPSALLTDFINKMSMTNQQDRATVMTLFTNAHLDFVIDTLLSINKADYSLESMVCQNKIYTFKNNPYNAKAIIVNGVHNMPIPILCAILAYVNRYHCNLFMTGSPEETIYDFNMAYNNAMNVISAYSSTKHIDIIRLANTNLMNDNIKNVLDMKHNTDLSNIYYTDVTTNPDTKISDVISSTMGLNTTYLKSKIDNHESVLILARSKSDLLEIKAMLNQEYKNIYPDLNVLDLTMIQPSATTYGEIASKYFNNINAKYPNGLHLQQFFYELYNCMAYEASVTGVPTSKNQCIIDKDNILDFFEKHKQDFPQTADVKTITQKLIDIEADTIQAYSAYIKDNVTIDINGADIVLSTIHTAIDIRSDNVIIFFRNFNENVDRNLYRVALSRANKSEYIVFANNGMFEVPHQLYLRTNIR